MSGSDVVSDAVIAGSGSGEIDDAIQNSKRPKKDRDSAFASPTPAGICSNCGTKLAGPVCHSCGQTADNYHRPVWELFMEVIDGIFGIEGRIWRTVPPLMFRPGWLTKQYLSGVRARFVLPFRLYLTASVLFFILMFSVNNGFEAAEPRLMDGATLEEIQEGVTELEDALEQADITGAEAALIQAQIQNQIERAMEDVEGASEDPVIQAALEDDWREDARNALRAALVPEDYPELVETREAQDQDPDQEGVQLADGISVNVDGTDTWPIGVRRFMLDAGISVIDDGGEQLMEEFQRWIPRLMFLMLPLYALMLGVTHFYKRGYFYYDHMVVSLHFHAFLFFLFILMMFAGLIIGPGWSLFILFFWSNYYLYRIHRTVYSHGRFSSALRVIFLDFAYLILLSFGALLAMMIAFAIQGT